MVRAWHAGLAAKGESEIGLQIGRSERDAVTNKTKGPGYGKNHAVRMSRSDYLCFLDADDVMAPQRVELQLAHLEDASRASMRDRVLLGCMFHREPADATPRYTQWCNALSSEQLRLQCYRENTIIQPTWFCSRTLFEHVGGYDETGYGIPEDMLFFYKHLSQGGLVQRVDHDLLMYRFVPRPFSAVVSKDGIWAARVAAIQSLLLDKLDRFGIWSAGRDGKRFYRSLSPANRVKVSAFFEVDEGKIKNGHYWDAEARRHVPIIHFSQAQPPAILCVKGDLHAGFEENLASMRWVEGTDYWHFC
jgi:glycosyltransferase involved in cell wall biosynthesis